MQLLRWPGGHQGTQLVEMRVLWYAQTEGTSGPRHRPLAWLPWLPQLHHPQHGGGFWRTQRRSRPTARVEQDTLSPQKKTVVKNATVLSLAANPEHYAAHLQGRIPSSRPNSKYIEGHADPKPWSALEWYYQQVVSSPTAQLKRCRRNWNMELAC